MNAVKRYWFLYIAFFLVILLEAFVVFSTPNLSYPETYSNLVKALGKEKGIHEGFYLFINAILFPLRAYNVNFSSQVMILKILSIVLASILLFLTYVLITHFSDDYKKSFFALVLFVTSPVFYLMTLNTLFNETFVIILMLATVSFWIDSIYNKKASLSLIALVSLLVISSPLSAFFIIAIYVYLVLHLLESKKILNFEKELAIYSTFLYAAYYIFFFKDYLLDKNLAIIVQEFLSPITTAFTHINISYIVPLIGPTTILFGIYALYSEISNDEKSSKKFYILASLLIVSFIFLITRLTNVYFLLLLLTISLSASASKALTLINSFFMKSRFNNRSKNLFLIFALLLNLGFAVFYLPQTIITNRANSIPNQMIVFLEKTDNLSEEPLNILSSGETSSLIEFYTKHSAVFTELDKDEVLKLKSTYNSPLEISIIDFLKEHNAQCLMLTDFERKDFNIDTLKAVDLEMLKQKLNISNNLLYCYEK
ncbi:MAG: hypothetical protein PWP03_428 [Candidatus Woesearchaeota archaeon]|nr:hypothetical protein [Candidatus Woesearchaeota archaeon]MDN5327790.1 hypothetical protein [Candidatus Woesearchaeota archaeon]